MVAVTKRCLAILVLFAIAGLQSSPERIELAHAIHSPLLSIDLLHAVNACSLKPVHVFVADHGDRHRTTLLVPLLGVASRGDGA